MGNKYEMSNLTAVTLLYLRKGNVCFVWNQKLTEIKYIYFIYQL